MKTLLGVAGAVLVFVVVSTVTAVMGKALVALLVFLCGW